MIKPNQSNKYNKSIYANIFDSNFLAFKFFKLVKCENHV